MEKVYAMTGRHEMLRKKVDVEEKMFPIYERHTDIIAKGKKEARFGREAQTSGAKGNLTLIYEIARGNPKGSDLYEETIEGAKREYGKTHESSAAGGTNIEYGKEEGMANIAFNKIAGSMRNI